MKMVAGMALVLMVGAGLFSVIAPRSIVVQSMPDAPDSVSGAVNDFQASSTPQSKGVSLGPEKPVVGDLPNQPKLSNPPTVVRGMYLTGWSAGSPAKVAWAIDFMKKHDLNAVVVDIKDYSGYVSYAMDVPEVKESGADKEIRILRPNAMLKEFHDNNIYVIGRVTVFQDPILAKAHPEWAFKNKNTGALWRDNHGLHWLDPVGKGPQDYVIGIARDAFARGFDEINFDYVRFASDGSLGAIGYPFWDQKTPRATVVKNFFAYLRSQLPNEIISADIFGLATYDTWNDLGIGQVLENAIPYFDYVCPMVYPSHYAAGTLNYKNPAAHPYEIIKYSMDVALKRVIAFGNKLASATSTAQSSNQQVAKLRPWLQAFDLGAVYTPEMVKAEMRASDEAFANTSTTNGSAHYGGWLLWDPANRYSSVR